MSADRFYAALLLAFPRRFRIRYAALMRQIFHERYQVYPEVWRQGNERGRIAAAQALCLVTAAAFVLLAWKTHQTDARGALKLAAMIWLIGPLPMLLANAMFIRIDRLVTVSHAIGWLAKLLLIATATAWFVK